MDLSLYLCGGLILSAWLAWRPVILSLCCLLIFWGVLFAWSLNLVHILTFHSVVWSQILGIAFKWHVDGLARLFSMMISGIGFWVFLYAWIYTQGNVKKRAKLLALLQVFALSMFGLVLTDNWIIFFLFWELTTLTSYLLIQFDTEDEAANQAAFNGMFVTVLGGLAMLVGFILIDIATGSWSIQQALKTFHDTSLLLPVFILCLSGAVTKSAQFPFHFWLPGAMKAPTPVSAYLHSATMVNAGIYLLARCHPLFGQLPQWSMALTFFGLSTMVVSAVLSLYQKDLKAILAYTTLFALGSMVYLLASSQWLAAKAFSVFFIFHGIYKAAAFMWVGGIDKRYQSRDISVLKGIGRREKWVFCIALVCFLAMAGLPPLYGFVVKGMIYEAKLTQNDFSFVLMGLSVLSSVLVAAVSMKILYYGLSDSHSPSKPKQRFSGGLWCPAMLSLLLVLLSMLEPYFDHRLSLAAQDILPGVLPHATHLSTMSIIFSFATVCIGGLLCLWVKDFHLKPHLMIRHLNIAMMFEKSLKRFLFLGRYFTFCSQRRSVGVHLEYLFAALIVWLLWIVMMNTQSITFAYWSSRSLSLNILSILLGFAGLSLCVSARFLINMVSLAVLGLLMSAFFVLQGAPDVAMTQLLVEILTVIIMVIALRKSHFEIYPLPITHKLYHGFIAFILGVGLILILCDMSHQVLPTHLGDYFIHNSSRLAHGRNIVNVILVDFRAIDTLGEALVIFATALAVFLLLDKASNTQHTKKRGC